MRLSIQLSAAVALSAACLLSVSAGAQDSAQATSPAREALSITDQDLDAEAAAIREVNRVRQNYQQQVASAKPDARPQMTDGAIDAVRKVVADHGLTMDKYQTILAVAEGNPSVRQRLFDRLYAPAH